MSMDAARQSETPRTGAGALADWDAPRKQSRGQAMGGFLKRLFQEKPLGAFGLVVVILLLLAALLADVVAPYHFDDQSFSRVLEPPSTSYLLGTDYLGRDMLSRLLYGARISLYVGMGAIFVSTIITVTLGTVSAWYGGRVDSLIQRGIVDVWISLPPLIVLLTLAATLGTGLIQMIFILSLGGFGSSRVIRGVVLSLKEQPFVDAARALGATTPRIIRYCILPNIMAPVLILATLKFGTVILAEASLAFLGYGIPPPFPTWGRMLSGQSLVYSYEAPWIVIWPGIALTLVVFSWNVLGDALRDLLDPRLRTGGGGKRRKPKKLP